MDHVAIMKKEWGFVEKILNGKKTVESRWYKNKSAPWDKIKKGDTVYFKHSGGLVYAQAEVQKIIQYENLNPGKVKTVLNEYGGMIGIEKKDAAEFLRKFRDKKYGVLIFLKNPRKTEPFQISKKGFGNMASWITVNEIQQISQG